MIEGLKEMIYVYFYFYYSGKGGGQNWQGGIIWIISNSNSKNYFRGCFNGYIIRKVGVGIHFSEWK